jgi:hypothetical protein
MAHFARGVKHPLATITNHGLVKILILDALRSTQMTWRQLLGLLEESVEEQQEEVEWGEQQGEMETRETGEAAETSGKLIRMMILRKLKMNRGLTIPCSHLWTVM